MTSPSIRRGLANGGPLDNVTISSGPVWDGTLRDNRSGFYRWNALMSRWDWILHDVKRRKRKSSLDDVKPFRAKRSTDLGAA